jgi:hypothetical protein
MNDKISEANTASQNEDTWKPGTTKDTIKSINPLIINIKNPSVKKINGRDRITKIGLIRAFTKPKMRLVSKMLRVLSNEMPLKKRLRR